MRKFITSIAVIAMAAAMMTGCGSSSSTASTTAATTTAAAAETTKETATAAEKTADLTGTISTQLPVIQSGCTGTAVLMLQAALGVTADGSFGNETETALKAFQENTKIIADGICGKDTWVNIFTHAQVNTFK